MTTIGIIAEFDPFHRGHEYLIRQARLHQPDSAVIVAMSGHFTQRGAPAALRPHARAEMALRCGADLVLELPLPWAISSAEGFARGGVAVLAAAGVHHLAFGSECGDAFRLKRISDALFSPEYPALLKQRLSSGCSFASARQQALSALIGAGNAQLLKQPNDLLGVSYLSAIRELSAPITATAIPRIGPQHNAQHIDGHFTSASNLRALLRQGSLTQAMGLLPEPARPVLQREWEDGLTPAALENMERAVLYRLRLMTEQDFLALPDCSEGLEHRLFRAAQQATSLTDFYALAKTKRYAHSRIRRVALWAFLNLTAGDIPQALPYLRVLGMNETGRAVLHGLKKNCPLPIITKPAAAKQLPEEVRRLFALELRSADLWRLCLPGLTGSAGGSGWSTGPVIIR